MVVTLLRVRGLFSSLFGNAFNPLFRSLFRDDCVFEFVCFGILKLFRHGFFSFHHNERCSSQVLVSFARPSKSRSCSRLASREVSLLCAAICQPKTENLCRSSARFRWKPRRLEISREACLSGCGKTENEFQSAAEPEPDQDAPLTMLAFILSVHSSPEPIWDDWESCAPETIEKISGQSERSDNDDPRRCSWIGACECRSVLGCSRLFLYRVFLAERSFLPFVRFLDELENRHPVCE